MLKARNYEFFRDTGAFGWNFAFPFLIILGFVFIFGAENNHEYKIGILSEQKGTTPHSTMKIPELLQQVTLSEFIPFDNLENALEKLKHHKIDMLFKQENGVNLYWINSTSPKGFIVESLMKATLVDKKRTETLLKKKEIEGREIRYIDWLFPGIIGMNIMFSGLWGVGYTVVRYRKNGVLKRLKATPLTSFEYLTAQMLSRMFLIMFMVIVVWTGSRLMFSFHVEGSVFTVMTLYCIGGLSLSSLGLVLAAKGTSEELVSGMINMITWPMMFLSEVWFSLEGAPGWIRWFANIFPLTHLLRGVRKVMNDGALFTDVIPEVSAMLLISLISLLLGAWLFSWNE